MDKTHIDGLIIEAMFRNGLNNLKLKEIEINNVNVFPVPDGDTGFNMRMTLENGLKNASSNEHAGKYLKALARGCLYGARGNSGVILSQLIRGLGEELEDKSILDCGELVEGFISAYKYAYEAVNNPKEGTLLTVAREGIIYIKDEFNRGDNVKTFFESYLDNIKNSLDNTPNLLPILKEAGVIDSGGLGYYYIVDGIVKYFNDIIIESINYIENNDQKTTNNTKLDMKYGYCTEFILQLLEDKKPYNKEELYNFLNSKGDSLVYVNLDNNIKVHVHTKTPGEVLNFAQEYGEFISIKIENMQLQNNEFIKKNQTQNKKDYSVIAIVNGDKLINNYYDINCDYVIDGGISMNSSTQDIIDAINKTNTNNIILIINNKNILMAAELAKKECKDKNIFIVKSNNVLEGYYGLLCSQDLDDFNDVYNRINSSIDALTSIEVFKSIRTTKLNDKKIRKDDFGCICKDQILNTDSDFIDCILDCLNDINDIEYRSNIILITGSSMPINKEHLLSILNDKFDYLEITIIEGNIGTYTCLLGVI